MELWQLWCLIGIVFFIVEMFTPVMFFLNLGLACFASGLAGYLGGDFAVQVWVFTLFAVIFLLFLRPFLINKKSNCSGKEDSEFGEKYQNKTAIVTEKITAQGGRVAIYGETWQAKSVNGQEIEKDVQVKIVKIESIVLFVETLN